MPAALVFHKGDALALDGVCIDALGLAVPGGVALIQCSYDLLHAVAIDLQRFPAEGAELLTQIAVGHHLVAGAVQLEIVAVYKDNQVIQLVLVGGIGSLPDLALLRFTVAHHAEHLVVLVIQLPCQRHTGGAGQTLSQRAGGNINAGAFVHGGVSLQHGALLAQRVQLGLGEEADACQAGILDGADMTLGEHHAVAIRPARVPGVEVHVLEIAGGNKICGGKRAARMAGLCLVDHVNDLHAHLYGGVFQLLNGNVFHKNHLIITFLKGYCNMSDKL